jgi:N-acetylglutamate synthase-like GNAT family acetyltransferase
LRWRILRQPWGQKLGTERDDLEFDETSFHAMAINTDGTIVGVARLQIIINFQAQIRYMAVDSQMQGKNVGSLLISYLEQIASKHGITNIILQARENAVPFYLKHNYTIKEKSFLLYNKIQHFLMAKELKSH